MKNNLVLLIFRFIFPSIIFYSYHYFIPLPTLNIIYSFLFYLLKLVPKGCAAAGAAKLLQSCPTLSDPIDGSPPGSSVPGILQAKILQWVALSLSNSCMHAKLLQSCLTLCDAMDGSPPGSSVHGIL